MKFDLVENWIVIRTNTQIQISISNNSSEWLFRKISFESVSNKAATQFQTIFTLLFIKWLSSHFL